jgi:predicted dehydrogenase
MQTSETLGAAVVGLGVGEQHALAYRQLDRCAVRWVYDLDPQRLQRVLATLRQGAAADCLETVLHDAAVHVVSIASYDDAHYGQVRAALQAGKHVFVEKPLCRSLAELRAIKQTWEAGERLHLASNLVLRAAPLYQWLRGAIAAGELGDIYAIDGDYLYGRLHKITAGWRNSQEHYSVMQGGGVHLIDLMLWLTGQRPNMVSAVGNRLCTAGTAFRYNDFMAATFQFPSGLVGRITANFGCVHRHQHVLRVFGTTGTFIYDDCQARLHRSRDPSQAALPIDLSPFPPCKGALIPAFVQGIMQHAEPSAQTQHEFDVISACVAADAASASAAPVAVVYV